MNRITHLPTADRTVVRLLNDPVAPITYEALCFARQLSDAEIGALRDEHEWYGGIGRGYVCVSIWRTARRTLVTLKYGYDV